MTLVFLVVVSIISDLPPQLEPTWFMWNASLKSNMSFYPSDESINKLSLPEQEIERVASRHKYINLGLAVIWETQLDDTETL